MSNGVSNHGFRQHSRNGNKPPAAPLEDDADEEILNDEDPLDPEKLFDEDSESDHDPFTTDELETAVREEPTIVKRREHPLRRIEARWEDKRLSDLLREVYEE